MYLERELAPNLKYITTIKWLVSQFEETSCNLRNMSGGKKAGVRLEAETLIASGW